MGQNEARRLRSPNRVSVFPEHQRAAREGGDHQSIPSSEDLLVAQRRRATSPRRIQLFVGLVYLPAQLHFCHWLRYVQDISTLEVSALGDPVIALDQRRAFGAEGGFE